MSNLTPGHIGTRKGAEAGVNRLGALSGRSIRRRPSQQALTSFDVYVILPFAVSAAQVAPGHWSANPRTSVWSVACVGNVPSFLP